MCRIASLSCGRTFLFSFRWQDSCTCSLALVRVCKKREFVRHRTVCEASISVVSFLPHKLSAGVSDSDRKKVAGTPLSLLCVGEGILPVSSHLRMLLWSMPSRH